MWKALSGQLEKKDCMGAFFRMMIRPENKAQPPKDEALHPS